MRLRLMVEARAFFGKGELGRLARTEVEESPLLGNGGNSSHACPACAGPTLIGLCVRLGQVQELESLMASLDGPLDGVRVLDLSALAPGPYCSMLLSDMGAEVILIQQAGRPQGRRDLAGRDPNEERRRYSGYALGRGKRSIGLNLKSEEAREIFYRLAEQADVVLEGFRPGVVARLGVDW